MTSKRSTIFAALVPFARWIVGGLFLYLGLMKVGHPVEFLKLVRQYELTESSLVLNFIAATLPWFEIFTGALLISGIAVRGAGVLALGMLLPFTIAIFRRAAAIHDAQGIPFCGIRFDCGCGAGEVLICRKLVENLGLALLSLLVVCVRSPALSLRYNLFSSSTIQR